MSPPKPLSSHARQVLAGLIKYGPTPSQEINPGVCRKLVLEGYATDKMLPSPYKKGGEVPHLVATGKEP